MPLFHPTATSAVKVGDNITVLCSLPENRNGGEIQVRLSGDLGAWTSPDSNGAYSSILGSITDTFLLLPAGLYDVRVLTGDDQYSNTLLSEISVVYASPIHEYGHEYGQEIMQNI